MIAKMLLDCLESPSIHFPESTAIIKPDGSSLTYAEMNRRANALATCLYRSGVGRGHRVGVMLPKTAEAIIALFGIMKVGAAYVPMDPSAPTERSLQILNDAELRACFVGPRSLSLVLSAQDKAKPHRVIVVGADADLSHPSVISYQAAIQSDSKSFESDVRSTDLAYLIYTSGSTGIPKGVTISHENAISFVNWYSTLVALNSKDRTAGTAPLFFDPAVHDIFSPLLHGASICLIPENAALNPKELAAFITERRVTVFCSSPSALTLLAQFGQLETHDASNLRTVVFGGEVFPVKELRELKRHWPKPVYYNLYGPTETTVACTSFRIPEAIPEGREQPFPIGVPAPYCKALVLDAQGEEVQEGQEGILHVSGPSISPGYRNRPAENATAFVMRDGQRWCNTGDWVRWDDRDGFIYLGRKDRMIKRRGYRIELDDIEKALHQHPRVREAAVVCSSDADGNKRIIAFLTLKPGDSISMVDWKIFCSSKLPVYMIPDQFLLQDPLPRTSTQKVDYQALTHALGSPG
jgi:amino acid adenylation domain-containing protein